MKKFLFVLFALAILKLGAQPGTLDKSFGTNGIIISETYGGTATAVVIQPDGKITAAGVGGYETMGGFLVVRYFPDGTLDSSFGNKGRALALTDIATVEVGDCALQKDGKLLVTGGVAINEPHNWVDFAIARFNGDGSPDKNFGNGGRVITNVGYYDYVKAISVQEDGRIVVSGYIDEINDDDTVFAVRYNANGTIDSSFAKNGVFKFTLPGIDFIIADHAVDQDGNLFIAGRYFFSSDVFVLKLDNNGVLDKSFGINGEAKYPAALQISNIALQSNGKIIISGTTSENFSAVRMNNDGSIDETFGANGHATGDFAETARTGALAIQANDDIIIGGYISSDPYFDNYYPALAKFKSTGLTDSAFGKNGLSMTENEKLTTIYDMALQNDGKIVAVGDNLIYGDPYFYHFFLARYENDFGRAYLFSRIKRWLHHHGFTWDDCPKIICNNFDYYSVQRSANGNSFSEIARIYKRDNQQHYNYEDASPLSGTNYYRLASVSTDGSVAYSNVIAIEDNEAAIKLYPNPVKNNLHIEGLSSTQKTKLTITDFSGIVKASATATGSYNWNVSKLKPGNYILRIETNGNAAVTKKFVKE